MALRGPETMCEQGKSGSAISYYSTSVVLPLNQGMITAVISLYRHKQVKQCSNQTFGCEAILLQNLYLP